LSLTLIAPSQKMITVHGMLAAETTSYHHQKHLLASKPP